ncbi:hypothetical protein HY844_02285 [Candidatus Berkelbacteria bacterium]|nr:hypothetical protein [Candidatus Berkelbacteria bacterium]
MHNSNKNKKIEVVARDFHNNDKNQFWYVGVGLIILTISGASVYLGDYILALTIIACGIAIFKASTLKPKSRKVALNNSGITIDDHFFAYHHIKSFWISAHNDSITVYLERAFPKTALSIVLPKNSAKEVMEVLAVHLPYHSHRGEPLSDKFSRILGL